jgi:uroporphyrinogen decarboxylase
VTGLQRIQAAFNGTKPDRVPVMLHNFMMAAREAGYTMAQFRSDPDVIARSFIDAIGRYDYDGILIDVDTVTLAGAAGVPIDYPDDAPARATGGMLASLEDIRSLQPVDIARNDRVRVWLEAARLLKRHFGDRILIRGNCDQNPFTLASLLRGTDGFLTELLDRDAHPLIHRLLRYATGITTQFIRLMAATGCQMLSNGDSMAGPELISPQLYRVFALPYAREVVDASHSAGLPYVLHICGNTSPILGDMISTGADGLELDYKTGMKTAHDLMADRCVFVGNIDPSGVLALGSRDEVTTKTRELLNTFADTPRFVLNAGCAIPPTTPSENIRAMISAARPS